MNSFIRALLKPAFPQITTAEIRARIREIEEGAMGKGETYVVPFGLTVHCVVCGDTLEAGDQSWIEEGTGSILCLRCADKRRRRVAVGPVEFKEPVLTRAQETRVADWMRYD